MKGGGGVEGDGEEVGLLKWEREEGRRRGRYAEGEGGGRVGRKRARGRS